MPAEARLYLAPGLSDSWTLACQPKPGASIAAVNAHSTSGSAPPADAGEMRPGYVLFMDLVAYSARPPDEQPREIVRLQELVRTTPAFAEARERADLLVLPAGDGMALVSYQDPVAPVRCAVQLSALLRQDGTLPLRMGIHTGLVTRLADFMGQPNAVGPGLNTAKRVMDCGDAGHILLSAQAAALLPAGCLEANWLQDLGWTRVKHGERLRLFSLRGPHCGNPNLPSGLRRIWMSGAEAEVPLSKSHAESAALRESGPPPSPAPAPRPVTDADLEQEGGAVLQNSRFYVRRTTDAAFEIALARRDSIILVKGPRQVGKTSLMARGLDGARQAGALQLSTDFQRFGAADLADQERFFRALADDVASGLNLESSPFTTWKSFRSAGVNFETFLRRQVLGATDRTLVWGLDEVDRLFSCPFASEVFGLFRSWHNARAHSRDGPWNRLTMVMGYATEAHLFITDLNQSPFNVGTRLTLDDFRFEEVQDLNERYGRPLSTEVELWRFHRLTGGQPFLVRVGLHELAVGRWNPSDFEERALADEGLVGEHLLRLGRLLADEAGLQACMTQVIREKGCADETGFYRLRAAGLVAGDSPASARPRCQLYAAYLDGRLP